jgi:hypothetical protein
MRRAPSRSSGWSLYRRRCFDLNLDLPAGHGHAPIGCIETQDEETDEDRGWTEPVESVKSRHQPDNITFEESLRPRRPDKGRWGARRRPARSSSRCLRLRARRERCRCQQERPEPCYEGRDPAHRWFHWGGSDDPTRDFGGWEPRPAAPPRGRVRCPPLRGRHLHWQRALEQRSAMTVASCSTALGAMLLMIVPLPWASVGLRRRFFAGWSGSLAWGWSVGPRGIARCLL